MSSTNEKFVITVDQLNGYLEKKFRDDLNIKHLLIKGEISNFKNHASGFYFTLKDEFSEVRAVMFKRNTLNMTFIPTDGMKVVVECDVNVYREKGYYQLYVSDIKEDGIGALYEQFEKLKKKLEQEGLFKEEHKKKLPKYPKKIGIITAPTGDAIHDIISTINRRYPVCETILFPSLVQGEFAKDDLIRNLNLADNYGLDVIIIGRGGGSIEDLWPFNEEEVARKIYEINTPIISGVGHEPDFTICDFVSDYRAPTPTGAAEACVPNKKDLLVLINEKSSRIKKNMLNKLELCKEKLDKYKNNHYLKNPMSYYDNFSMKLDNLLERVINSTNNILIDRKYKLDKLTSSYVFKNPNQLFIEKIYNYNDLINRLKKSINLNLDNNNNKLLRMIDKLDVLNPTKTLKRGFTITRIDNKSINSIKDIKTNSIIETQLQDGTIYSTVTNIEENL